MVSKPDTEVDGGFDVAVPDSLLLPLIEAAADVLKSLEAVDVPAQLRPLHGFDRRGLLAGPAPRQLRRALHTDAAFREQVLEQFLARSEVEGMLAAWNAERRGGECGRRRDTRRSRVVRLDAVGRATRRVRVRPRHRGRARRAGAATGNATSAKARAGIRSAPRSKKRGAAPTSDAWKPRRLPHGSSTSCNASAARRRRGKTTRWRPPRSPSVRSTRCAPSSIKRAPRPKSSSTGRPARRSARTRSRRTCAGPAPTTAISG